MKEEQKLRVGNEKTANQWDLRQSYVVQAALELASVKVVLNFLTAFSLLRCWKLLHIGNSVHVEVRRTDRVC